MRNSVLCRRDLKYLELILQKYAWWKERRIMNRRVCSYDMFAVPDRYGQGGCEVKMGNQVRI